MDNFNDIGISNKLDARRIRKLLLIGLLAALIAIAADMILGWNVVSDGSELGTFSKYMGIIIVAVLRLFGNHEWVNALSTGWISIGGIFTFAGLLIACRKHLKEA